MATIGKLVVDFLTNRTAFVSDVGQMRTALKSNVARMNAALLTAEKHWGSLKKSIAKNLKGLLDWRKGLLLLVGAGGIGALVSMSYDATVQLRKLSVMAGTTAESFQELAHAAARYEINNDALADGLKELALRTDEFVKTGKGPAEEAFSRLGLGAADLNTKLNDSAELFDVVAKALDGVESEAARIRIADELFGGTGGEQFVELLKQGSREIERLRFEARELGLVMSNEVVAGASQARAKLDTLQRVIKTKVTAAIVENADKIDQLATAFTNAIPKAIEFMKAMGLVDRTPAERLRELADETGKLQQRLSEINAFRAENGGGLLPPLMEAEAAEKVARLRELRAEQLKLMNEISSAPAPAGAPASVSPGRAIRPNPDKDKDSDKAKRGFGDLLVKLEKNRQRRVKQLEGEAEIIRRSVLTAGEAHAEQLERLTQLRDQNYISQETFNRAVAEADKVLAEATDKTRLWGEAFDQMGDASVHALERMVLEGGKARDVIANLLRDMASITLRQSLSGIGGAVSRGLSSVFGGFRAEGGPVSAGMSYVVGERGPEVLTVGGSGFITPNHELGGGTVVNIDARGAEAGVERKIAAAMQQVLAQVPGLAVRATSQAIRQGGSYARQVGRA